MSEQDDFLERQQKRVSEFWERKLAAEPAKDEPTNPYSVPICRYCRSHYHGPKMCPDYKNNPTGRCQPLEPATQPAPAVPPVKRYSCWRRIGDAEAQMHEQLEGDYVSSSDYDSLKSRFRWVKSQTDSDGQEILRQRAQIAALREEIQQAHDNFLGMQEKAATLMNAILFACETINQGSAYCSDCEKGVMWEPDELIEYVAQNMFHKQPAAPDKETQ